MDLDVDLMAEVKNTLICSENYIILQQCNTEKQEKSTYVPNHDKNDISFVQLYVCVMRQEYIEGSYFMLNVYIYCICVRVLFTYTFIIFT